MARSGYQCDLGFIARRCCVSLGEGTMMVRFQVLVAVFLVVALGACARGEVGPAESRMQDALAEFAIRQAVALEDSIGLCMAEQGFDYEPRTRAAIEEQSRPTIDRPDPTSSYEDLRRWVAEYGYGLAATIESSLNGGFQSEADLEGVEMEDPDYLAALWGSDGHEGGCASQARTAFESSEQIQSVRRVEERAIEAQNSLLGDPSFLDLQSSWAQCMRLEGFQFARFDEPQQSMVGRSNEVAGLLNLELMGLFDRFAAEASQSEGWDGEFIRSQLSQPVLEALNQLREEELVLALADLQCQQGVRSQVEELSDQYMAEVQEQLQSAYEDLINK
jgi:hypothetical protein